MATTTPLGDVLTARWNAAEHANQLGSGDDAVNDAVMNMLEALIRDYRVSVDSATGESVDIGAEWLEPLEASALAAGAAAWREHVEPVVIAAVLEGLEQAPDWLRLHPRSGQLRADWELLETAQSG